MHPSGRPGDRICGFLRPLGIRSPDWTPPHRQGNLDDVEVTPSGERHAIAVEDTLHAWRNAILVREVVYERTGLTQILAIGPARDGKLLELIAVPPWRATRIIHSMPLRPKFRAYLEGDA